MTINANSKASIVGAGIKNVQFVPSVSVVPRKIVIIGTYDPSLLDVVPNVPVRIFNENEAGVLFGFGFMIHRLAEMVFLGSRGSVETWVVPQAETGSQATGALDFTGSTGVQAGTLHFYMASLYAPVTLEKDDGPDDIATKVATAMSAAVDKTLPADGVAATNVVNITAKSKGVWGNDITLAFNLRPGEETPDGVSISTSDPDMSGGAGIPDIQDALDGLGVGDNQNEKYFTAVVHGYGADTDTLDKISAYNGTGNDFNGNYRQEVARPFRSLNGDTAPASAGLTALLAAADLRKELDRTNGILGVPGSFHHPAELAANAMGIMERVSNLRPQETYTNRVMPGIIPGPSTERWTDDYETGRDVAVRGGISTTMFKNNVMTLQDMVTLYRPDAVDPNSNGYRAMRNIAITQNILDNIKANFEREKWQGVTVVEDTAIASEAVDAEKARDDEDVKDDLLVLNELFARKTWAYNIGFFVERLKADPSLVELREDGRGWNIRYQTIYSGEGGIFNTITEFDVSLAVFIQS